jgi:hypothetical protein
MASAEESAGVSYGTEMPGRYHRIENIRSLAASPGAFLNTSPKACPLM